MLRQDERASLLKTPLGKDTLVLTAFEGTEGLSEVFEYSVAALSEQENVNFDSALGRNCSVKIKTYKSGERIFNGTLIRAQWLGRREDNFAYRLELRPWLWFLRHTSNCKIFKDQSVPDIVKAVFDDRGYTDYKLKLTQSYPKIEYCVQYRETDFDFVSRLMEEYGIYYFFEHTEEKHTLVLADAPSCHTPLSGLDKVVFLPRGSSDQRDRAHFVSWTSERNFRSGKFTLNDYDYLKPSASLKADAQGSEHYSSAKLERYDYPGRYIDRGLGERLARIRLEAEQAFDHRREAHGDAVGLTPGGRFKLEQHPTGAENAEHLVLRAEHHFEAEQYRSGSDGGAGESYSGRYVFLKSDQPYRALQETPKPRIHGPQTAKVVGKSGEEIDVDEHGRITVQFHWDRDKKPSRRVRVAQNWAGKSWGQQIIPRIGHEVVVEFLDGDPDFPLVVGSVYNGENDLPYDLPANKTKSGLKSDSSKGGRGYNELALEDKKGSEKVNLRAEKDLDVLVRNKEEREIGEAFTPPLGMPSRKTTLKNGDDVLEVKSGNQDVKVAMNITTKAGPMLTMEAEAMMQFKVGQSTITMTPASITIHSPIVMVSADGLMSVSGTMTTVSGSAVLTLAGGLVAIN
jgi:type VI secretion system secreted protein VgrG